MRALEHKIPPPIVAVIAGAAMWAVSRMTPSLPIDSRLRVALAGAFAGFGVSACQDNHQPGKAARSFIDRYYWRLPPYSQSHVRRLGLVTAGLGCVSGSSLDDSWSGVVRALHHALSNCSR